MPHEPLPTYFRSNFLSLSYPERLTAKVISAGAYGLLAATTFLFLSFGLKTRFGWLGVGLLLFLVDRLLQYWRGEKAITSDVIAMVDAKQSFNIEPYFQDRTKKFLENSLSRAEVSGARSPALFLLENFAGLPEIRRGLLRLSIVEADFRKAVLEKLQSFPKEGGVKSREALRAEVESLGNLAFREAVHFGEHSVSPAALFLGVLAARADELKDIFAKFNFAEEDFHNAIIFGRLAQGLGKKMIRRPGVAAGRRRSPQHVMNRAWTSRPTPFLDRFSEDITELARHDVTGFLIGHEAEYKDLVSILNREEKNNALLVGEAGVGKESIVENLAFKITRDEVPAKLFDRRLIKLNITAITSGAKTAGDIQEKLERVVSEILIAGNVVLYIPDIHNLKLTSGEGLNAFEFMKPIFASSQIVVVADTTPQDYRRVIEQDSDFRALFDVVRVEELSEEEAARLLTYQSFILEAKWNMTISYRALKRAVQLAHRYLRTKPLPASALDLLEEALADAKSQKREVLTEEDVASLVTRKTKIPLGIAVKAEAEKLLGLEDKIHERMINQEEAVKAVASAMRQYRAGLSRAKGPIATFLFVGPTGVGKTELSKALTAIYFGNEEDMIRFDMSEYQEPKAIMNFIGSPDGSVRGNLTEAAKAKPFSLILFDEFEKAHSDIIELFLPLFDEGRLADSMGTVIDFTNTIMICTSNAHSDLIKTELEKGTTMTEIAAIVKKRLTEYFKPELINRFDAIIAFRPLKMEEIVKIAALNVSGLFKRLEAEQGITAVVDPEVNTLLAKIGWDPVFGARPLRGAIREKINEVLAQKILKQEISSGDKITLKVSGDQIVVEKV